MFKGYLCVCSRIPGTEEPGGLRSVGLHRVRRDGSDSAAVVASVVSSPSRPRALWPPGSSSVGFSRRELWSGLPAPSPGHLPDPEMKPEPLMSSAWAGRFFTPSAAWKHHRLGG